MRRLTAHVVARFRAKGLDVDRVRVGVEMAASAAVRDACVMLGARKAGATLPPGSTDQPTSAMSPPPSWSALPLKGAVKHRLIAQLRLALPGVVLAIDAVADLSVFFTHSGSADEAAIAAG